MSVSADMFEVRDLVGWKNDMAGMVSTLEKLEIHGEFPMGKTSIRLYVFMDQIYFPHLTYLRINGKNYK